jgi:hypothetical protein
MTPGGTLPNAGVAHNTFTYAAPGVYEQRVRLTVAGLPTRTFSARIFVGSRTADRTPAYMSIGVPFATLADQPTAIEATSSSPFGNADMTFDLDGDGEFDDQPTYLGGSYYWTFTKPVTIAVKATDPASGASTVGTVQVQPAGADATPAVTLNVDGAGRASYVVDDAAGATSWDASWDTDGDGAYDDGTGPTSAPITGAGPRTVGLRVVDSAHRTAVVRKTFGGGTAANGPAKALKVRMTVTKAKLATLLKRGLRVKPGCEAACTATVTVTVSKATARRLELRSRTLGKAAGKGKTVTIKVSAKARKALRHARSVKLTVTVGAKSTDGRTGTAEHNVTLRR